MKHFCNSLLLCGIAFLLVPAANAQDVSIRRVTDRVITLSMSNLSIHTNVTVIETRKGLVCIETESVPSVMKKIKKAAEIKLGRNDWAYVINTHPHLHHAGGNAAFPDTPIIGTDQEDNGCEPQMATVKQGGTQAVLRFRRGNLWYQGIATGPGPGKVDCRTERNAAPETSLLLCD